MLIPIARLRRWFALGAIIITVIVAAAYFFGHWQVRKALKAVPKKIGYEVQQSAQEFTISRSEQGRTIFTVRASKAVQFKQGGRTELHDVYIIVYGRDASRYDRIYGADFEYDPQSGDVSAKGDVQIDLEANPAGLASPDQAPPKELKNPIHLKTSGLVFNQKTGNAYTKEKVEFRVPQASGSATGVDYVAKGNLLTLQSRIEILLNGPNPSRVTARRGVITKEPRQVVLERPRMTRSDEKLESEKATFFLRDDNTVERILASGDVRADMKGRSEMQASAAQAELLMTGDRATLRTAVLSGNVQIESTGRHNIQGNAGRVILSFSGKNRLDKIHAEEGVKLAQHQAPAQTTTVPNTATSNALGTHAQDLEITAPAMDFFVQNGERFNRAETSGTAQIQILQANSNQRTIVTAGRFEAKFGDGSRLASLHGEPDTKIVTNTLGQADRVTTSKALDVVFRPEGGVASIAQQGGFAYSDGDRKAWADRARYTPADQMLTLIGSPRVVEGGMSTTARTMRINRVSGDAFADGDVKSTYSQLKEQPSGALLASSDPIHVTSRGMTAHRSPAIAVYTGGARLWQNANVVEAPNIQFDRDQRSVTAEGNGHWVSTVLVQVDKAGKATPVTITSTRLTYADSERKVHFAGRVLVKGADMTVTAKQMDVILLPRTQASTNQSLAGEGRLDKIVANGNVVIQQPARRATGEKLVYSASEDKFVLTGGSPSIFDAEHGQITGDSLTFYKRDDRVLVEGRETSPTVTHTRVAR